MLGHTLVKRTALYAILVGVILAPDSFGQSEASPSLKDTLEWMKNTASEHPEQHVQIGGISYIGFRGECELLLKEDDPLNDTRYTEEGCLHPTGEKCTPEDYRVQLHGCLHQKTGVDDVGEVMDDSSIDVFDGKEHTWQWFRTQLNFSYSECLLTIKTLDWKTDRVPRKSQSGVLNYVKPEDHVAFTGEETVDLKQLNPDSVSVSQPSRGTAKFVEGLVDSISTETFHQRVPRYKELRLPTSFSNAHVQVKYTDEEHHVLGKLWGMEYPYAERFAHALRNAITLCGGKPPAY